MLTERQALFKQAALEAKKAGNMEEAKGGTYYLYDVLKIGCAPTFYLFIIIIQGDSSPQDLGWVHIHELCFIRGS